MKKTLKLALACTLGAAFVFVGCTKDYSSDISKLDTRVSAIEKENVAQRLKALEDADASFTAQIAEINKAIAATNDEIATIKKEYAKASDVDAKIAAINDEIKLLKGKVALCATKDELNAAVEDIYENIYANFYTKPEIDEKFSVDVIWFDGSTVHFDSLQELAQWLHDDYLDWANILMDNDQILNSNINFVYSLLLTIEDELLQADAALDARITTIETWKVEAQAAIDQQRIDIDKNADAISDLADKLTAAETDLGNRIEGVSSRVAAVETALGEFSEVKFNQYVADTKIIIDGIKDNITELYKKLGIVDAKIGDLNGRINSIAAKAPVGQGNVEAQQFLFGDIDKTKVTMSFNITPANAASSITAENSVLVITEGESRTKAAEIDNCKEYTFFGTPVAGNGVVTVAAFIQTKLNAANKYWATLKYTGKDEAGEYTIASAPVEVLEGECIDLTDPANLTWFNKKDEKVAVAAEFAEAKADEFQYYAPDCAPALYTAIDEVDYTTVYLQGESKVFENVFNGYYLKVKVGDNKYKKLSEIKAEYDLTDAQIAIDAKAGVQNVAKPANSYWGTYEGTDATVVADKNLFTYITTEALGDVDVKVAYPDSYYEGLQTVAKRWLAVGTSSKYTIPAITIGGVNYAGLEVNHRVYFAGHKETSETKITEFKPFVEWDYINFDKTKAIAGNGESNGAFYGYDIVANANMQILSMFKGVGAAAPLTGVTYTTQDSQKRVDLFINEVAVSEVDQNLTAKWEKSDVEKCEPTGVIVNANVFKTELPFTVEARHADVTKTYAPDAFIPNQAKADEITLVGGIVDNKFTDDAKNWTGSLNKTIADVKAAYAAEIAAATVNITVKEGTADKTADLKDKFTLDTATGKLTIAAGALDYNKTYTVTYTWKVFDVTFTDVITLTTLVPEFSLKTRDLYVDPETKTVTIEGQLVNYTDDQMFQFLFGNPQAYIIKDAHMNKYVYVDNFDVTETTTETLTIDFAVTEQKVALHPEATTGVKGNNGDGIISTDIYTCWNKALWPTLISDSAVHGSFKGESTEVTATLKANGRKVNEVKFTIKRIDPIKVEAEYEIDVNKVSATSVTVNALQNLSVIGTLPFDMEEKTTELWDNEKLCWKYEAPHYNYGQTNDYRFRGRDLIKVTPNNIKIDWAKLSCAQAVLYEGVDYTINGNEITIIKDNSGVAFTIEVPVEITLNYGEEPYKTTAKINVKQGR